MAHIPSYKKAAAASMMRKSQMRQCFLFYTEINRKNLQKKIASFENRAKIENIT